MEALQRSLTIYQQHFIEPVADYVQHYLQALCDKLPSAEAEELCAISAALLQKIIDNKGEQHIATVALCFPFIIQLSISHNTLHDTFEAKLLPLLKQCILIKNLDKTLNQSDDYSNKQSDQLRKMLLAMAGDTRVILLVLLYQLSLLEQAKYKDEAYKKHLAALTQKIYAPLANRLGMGKIKWQLEDLAFRFSNPDDYQDIKQALNMRRSDREQYVQHMQDSIQSMVNEANIKNYHCAGRAKHIYSIYKKCSKKGVGYDALYDTIALRILTDTVDECYTLLSAIQNKFTPIPSEFDDYISHPKPNGYQSIHTVILGPNQHRVEIQMRTFDMHHQAEHGAYAHWIYKEGKQSNTQNYEAKIAHLRQLLDWQASVQTEDNDQPEPDQTHISNLFSDRIYVFTPQGTIIDLPQGATPLDFAYIIHTDIGHRTKGALINGKLLPLSYPLTNGDVIQIQLKKEPHPSRDWLNPSLGFIKTKQAKHKIAAWFKKQNQQQNLIKGQQVWEKVWRNKKLDRHLINDIYQYFNFKDSNALLVALGAGDISVPAVLQHIKSILQTPSTEAKASSFTVTPDKRLKHTDHKTQIIIANNSGLLYKLAKCCTPIPGDDIVAYISSARGAIIHQKQCKNIKKALANHHEKILEAHWNTDKALPFATNLIIFAKDRDHLLHDITSLCAQYQVSIKQFAAKSKTKGNGPNQINLSIIVDDQTTYDKFLTQLKQCEGILSVNRLKQ